MNYLLELIQNLSPSCLTSEKEVDFTFFCHKMVGRLGLNASLCIVLNVSASFP
jgi:hypothetical protein